MNNTTQQAIKNVIEKRISRGAGYSHIEEYKEHLKTVWKNNSTMIEFINTIDTKHLLEGVK